MSKRWRSHYLPSPRPSIWKRFRSLETRLCTQPCTRFTLPLRSIRPKRLRFGVVRRHWRTYRAQAGHLGLDQQLPVEAAADIFFLADLQIILGRFGNRGYRAVQLEAGILSGKLYLAAYAQRLSATGLTFYDDAVIRFFSPHAHDKSVIMLLAVGKNAKSMLQG